MAPEASEIVPEDFISNMPDNVITNILDLLPIQDAVKTSSLSKNWRFKWTMLSQLIFDEMFFIYLMGVRCVHKFRRIISSLLLNLKGAITKFVLYIEEERCCNILDDEDIAHWILFLSKKGIKDLTISKMHGPQLNLPTHLFSCSELKHLRLFYCWFDPPTNFHGFPNLLSLELGLVQFESSKFGEFLTKCPLLEILNMRFRRLFIDILNMRYRRDPLEPTSMDIFSIGEVNVSDFAALSNLKILSLTSCHLAMITSASTIFKLVGFLPNLQEFDFDFVNYQFTEDDAKKRYPTSFPCLKVLKLSTIELRDDIMLSCAFDVIRSFPNLQTLEITSCDWDFYQDVDQYADQEFDQDADQYVDQDADQYVDPTPANPPIDVDDNTMGLLQLQNVVFKYYEVSDNEVSLMKYLLACSPFLKKIVIRPCLYSLMLAEEKLKLARKLLKFYRASPRVDIDLV